MVDIYIMQNIQIPTMHTHTYTRVVMEKMIKNGWALIAKVHGWNVSIKFLIKEEID